MHYSFEWKKSSFFQVNLFEILHASTYDFYIYLYKVKKPAADGNPDL